MNPSLTEQYGHKIKSVEELLEIIGKFPREKKVILCHGVFDVVHPGHVRHLLYAKSKADILVTSITADKYITKGLYRPDIPQDLRALNLAAFEIIDYVVIDENSTPLKNIELLQPDYFAKGYEYISNGLKTKTSEENDILESYGGEIIFTPGDIVYSSSQLINLAPPSISDEKLITLMESEGISFNDLRETLKQMKGKRIHVIGDTIVDTYTETAMIGGQTKTPTISVLYQGKKDYIGGAAIVAKHVRSAGAEVIFTTVLGDDALKDLVLNGLQSDGIEVNAVIDPLRPTTNKNAIVCSGYRMIKIDMLDNSSISGDVYEQVLDSIGKEDTDAVIFSDFRHGIFNINTIPKFIEQIPENTYRVADSQVASRWGNITEFGNFDLITPNEREARFALGDQDSGVRPLASKLYDVTGCKVLILKLGDRGVITSSNSKQGPSDSFFVLDSFVTNLVDAVGAGDALLAYSTLGMLTSGSEVQSTILGCMAAACECECDGNIPVSPEGVLNKIDTVEKRINYS